MLLVQWFAPVADVEPAHFSFDATRIEAATTTDASTSGNFVEQRVTPRRQTLRGEWPQLAASCA
jgi:hypothetical protein